MRLRQYWQLLWQRGRLFGLLGALGFGLALMLVMRMPAWGAQPVIQTQTRYYAISGTTAAALRQQMNQLGPVGTAGRRFDAHTKWHVTWHYRYGLVGGSCRMTGVTVNTTITYTMPQWTTMAQAPLALQRQWQRYYQALQYHEDGHAHHGQAATQEIWQRLNRFSQPTCATMSQAANQAAQGIIGFYAQKDVAYDRQTDHGRTQGAVFP